MQAAFKVSSKFRQDLTVTPYNICVAVIISCYFKEKMGCSMDIELFESTRPTKQQQRNSYFLFLKLISQTEMTYSELMEVCQNVMHKSAFFEAYNEIADLRKDDMNIVLLMKEVENLMLENDDMRGKSPVIHRSSVLGKFLRKMFLAVYVLDFTSLMTLNKDLSSYIGNMNTINASKSKGFSLLSANVTMEDLSVAMETSENMHLSSMETCAAGDCPSYTNIGKERARLFFKRQAERLRYNPKMALTPQLLHEELQQILKSKPDLTEAYYLVYVNNMLYGEYNGSVDNCHNYFLQLKNSNCPRKFRYALLNLAMIHRRFGHNEQAELALKECVELSQKADDRVCLQNALVWLCKTNNDLMGSFVRTTVVQSSIHSLWSLHSLALQYLAKLGAISGCTPSFCFDGLNSNRIIQTESVEALLNRSISIAVLWISYGFHENAKIIFEEIFHYSQTKVSASQKQCSITNESTILAIIFYSGYCVLDYEYEKADILLNLARDMLAPHSEHNKIIESADLCNKIERSLRQENYQQCKKYIRSLALYSAADAQLYEARLYHQMGSLEKAVTCLESLPHDQSQGNSRDLISWLVHARILGEEQGESALHFIIKGLGVCDRFHLKYLQSIFKLELLRTQGVRRMSKKMIKTTLEALTPMILAHGSTEDKLLRKSVEAEVAEDPRVAIKLMSECVEFWLHVGDVHACKKGLQFLARKCNEVGDLTMRKQATKLFRELATKSEKS